MTGTTQRRDPRIVILGAGMAGIAVAHVLKQSGFNDFTILEKGSDVGGVWHWNRYPGLRCDVPSYGYQFAFAPKPDWKHVWATGDEIQRYHHDLIDALALKSHLRLDCEVTEAVLAENRWRAPRVGTRSRRTSSSQQPASCTTRSSRISRASTRSPDRWCTPRAGLTSMRAANGWR
jgi:cation diffusion facilitator CzcD-associated flavoprotein CzcO